MFGGILKWGAVGAAMAASDATVSSAYCTDRDSAGTYRLPHEAKAHSRAKAKAKAAKKARKRNRR